MKHFCIIILLGILFSACSEKQKKNNEAVSSGSLKEDPNPTQNTPSRINGTEKREASQAIVQEVTPSDLATDPPKDMVLIPTGMVDLGSETGLSHELPIQRIEVKAFFMDKHPVTVAQFRKFVDATGYRTQAEIFGDAGVFDIQNKHWKLQSGANWQYPRGPEHEKARDNHPVTQVSWNDAAAYAKWAGKRLPTEVEWEHAARNAENSRHNFSWGNNLIENGKYLANTWQGIFPFSNYVKDGYQYTSPVGVFGETSLGLQDISGNVWEWCANWKLPYGLGTANFVPDDTSEKALRGGSFLCEPSWCYGYRVSARSGSTPETSLFHVGFRCVKSL